MLARLLVAVVIGLAVLGARGARGEMPDPPKLQSLYSQAAVVLQGEAVRVHPETRLSMEVRYRIVTFRVVEEYKGKAQVMSSAELENGSTQPGRYVSVILQTGSIYDCRRIPKYEVGAKYVLFLGDTAGEHLYSRTKLDRIWEERPADAEMVKQLVELQKERE